MGLNLELPEIVARRLAARAATSGQTPAEVAIRLLTDATADDEKTFAEVVEPFRKAFETSGMTEEELDALIDEARREIWDEKQRATS